MNKVMEYYEGCECNPERDEEGNEISGKYLEYNLLFTMLTISSLATSIFALGWLGMSSKVMSKA